MGAQSRNRNRESDTDLARLQSEYDAELGGYNITIKAPRHKGSIANQQKDTTEFIKSDYTPRQGGYYADKSILRDPTQPYKKRTRTNQGNEYRFYDANRTSYITGDTEGSRLQPNNVTGGGAVGREDQKSARKPYRRVNPSIRQQRNTRRRQRIVAGGRRGTVLTGTLGGTEDERKKKTILG